MAPWLIKVIECLPGFVSSWLHYWNLHWIYTKSAFLSFACVLPPVLSAFERRRHSPPMSVVLELYQRNLLRFVRAPHVWKWSDQLRLSSQHIYWRIRSDLCMYRTQLSSLPWSFQWTWLRFQETFSPPHMLNCGLMRDNTADRICVRK